MKFIFPLLFLFSCTYKDTCDRRLAAFINKSEEDLISVFGIPTKTYIEEDQDKYLFFEWSSITEKNPLIGNNGKDYYACNIFFTIDAKTKKVKLYKHQDAAIIGPNVGYSCYYYLENVIPQRYYRKESLI
jgi:hypothetical protein